MLPRNEIHFYLNFLLSRLAPLLFFSLHVVIISTKFRALRVFCWPSFVCDRGSKRKSQFSLSLSVVFVATGTSEANCRLYGIAYSKTTGKRTTTLERSIDLVGGLVSDRGSAATTLSFCWMLRSDVCVCVIVVTECGDTSRYSAAVAPAAALPFRSSR